MKGVGNHERNTNPWHAGTSDEHPIYRSIGSSIFAWRNAEKIPSGLINKG